MKSEEIHWRCNTDLGTDYVLGPVNVVCEPMGNEKKQVLKDSCYLEYFLEYSERGYRKANSIPDPDAEDMLMWIFLVIVVIFIAILFFFFGRTPSSSSSAFSSSPKNDYSSKDSYSPSPSSSSSNESYAQRSSASFSGATRR